MRGKDTRLCKSGDWAMPRRAWPDTFHSDMSHYDPNGGFRLCITGAQTMEQDRLSSTKSDVWGATTSGCSTVAQCGPTGATADLSAQAVDSVWLNTEPRSVAPRLPAPIRDMVGLALTLHDQDWITPVSGKSMTFILTPRLAATDQRRPDCGFRTVLRSTCAS